LESFPLWGSHSIEGVITNTFLWNKNHINPKEVRHLYKSQTPLGFLELSATWGGVTLNTTSTLTLMGWLAGTHNLNIHDYSFTSLTLIKNDGISIK